MTVRLIVNGAAQSSAMREALVVPLSAHIQRKRAFFGVLKKHLRLPNLYRDNWDALFDVLRDPETYAHARTVVLDHASLPFAADSPQRAIYLEFLEGLMSESDAVPGEVFISLPATEAAVFERLRRVQTTDPGGT